MNASKRTQLRCSHDIRELDARCFLLTDDGRKWRRLCEERRTLYVELALRANADGTSVFIGRTKMEKSGIRGKTLERRLQDLQDLGCLFTEVHIDRDGERRERLSKYGTKRRRLWWERLEIAQAIINSGSEFAGHDRLSAAEFAAIQDDLSALGASDSSETVGQKASDSPDRTSDAFKETPHRIEKVSKERRPSDAQPPLSTDRPKETAQEEVGNSSPSSDDKKRTEDLIGFFRKGLTAAMKVRSIVVYDKQRTRIVDELNTVVPAVTEEEVAWGFRKLVGECSDFQAENFGSILIGSLVSKIGDLRLERAEEAKRAQIMAEIERRAADEQARSDEWLAQKRKQEEFDRMHADDLGVLPDKDAA